MGEIMTSVAFQTAAREYVGMLWIFGWLVFFLVLKAMADRNRRHKLDLIHKERLAAMEKGIPMPELPEYEVPQPRLGIADRLALNPRWPLGLGTISILLGLGVSVALYFSGDSYHNEVWPFGLIGVFLGVGLYLHFALTRRDDR
jgi:hypothetical protein